MLHGPTVSFLNYMPGITDPPYITRFIFCGPSFIVVETNRLMAPKAQPKKLGRNLRVCRFNVGYCFRDTCFSGINQLEAHIHFGDLKKIPAPPAKAATAEKLTYSNCKARTLSFNPRKKSVSRFVGIFTLEVATQRCRVTS